ncbi:MAG TPA: TIGR00730 family Rossman fold protein [Hellea balneolensis]|uniref:Cytokinin riboside 5'-monophosphate phosphoribohydrolase n=1 Tax=Hellea balneolensis TaxID=287478 RepID=A0A7C3GDR2_9PROT|nr:TIGR00730 family Rossman fold protein [Hellea balneolensis]
MKTAKSICVFCGASKAVDEHYYTLAKSVGKALAMRNYRLVYGGGSIGLMGASALAAYEAGGEVLGIIPQFLADIEEVLTVIEHRIVKDMHERKHQMYEESDAYIVLPGGIGTLEEAIEVMSWMRLHLHTKPMVFVDTDGYWAPLMQLLNHTIDAHFSPAWVSGHLFYEQSVEAALTVIEEQWINPAPKGDIKVAIIDKV